MHLVEEAEEDLVRVEARPLNPQGHCLRVRRLLLGSRRRMPSRIRWEQCRRDSYWIS